MWLRIIAVIGAAAPVVFDAHAAAAPALTAERVNAAEFAAKPAKAKGPQPAVLRAQVLLDRSGFSPGTIDGVGGENFAKALKAYQQQYELEPTGKLDAATFAKLTGADVEPALVAYEIGAGDLKGPFVKKIPEKLEDKAALPRLGYTGPRELLAEKFHASEPLLKALNPKASFERAGESLTVPNVARRNGAPKAARLVIDKAERSLRVLDEGGKPLAYFPVSIGSGEKPAPSGTHSVRAVTENPTYRYDPKYAFKDVKATKPFKVAPGPNNPVGAVWIDLSVESYGIHGTPDPDKVSKTESHGCVRLTNWDALALARMVRKGTPVEFVDSAAASAAPTTGAAPASGAAPANGATPADGSARAAPSKRARGRS
jgi:lipoprotein-anchoring transpeptidase ErfK/SrfK